MTPNAGIDRRAANKDTMEETKHHERQAIRASGRMTGWAARKEKKTMKRKKTLFRPHVH